MLILNGILRQAAEMQFDKDGAKVTKTKLWLEHYSPRDNGVQDIKIEELFLDGVTPAQLPKSGEECSISVRAYPAGNAVKFAAISYVGKLHTPVAQKGN